MAKTSARQITVAAIARKGAIGVIIIRLMMALSDLTLASEAFGRHHTGSRRDIAARHYYARLQLAHLDEALQIIHDINQEHLTYIEQCPEDIQQLFGCAAAHLAGSDYKRIIKPIRNNIGFHYGHNGSMISTALRYIEENRPDHPVWMQRGEKPSDWVFEPAVWVAEHIVLRQIFKLPAESDVLVESAAILDRLMTIQNDFSGFATEFIEHETRRFGRV